MSPNGEHGTPALPDEDLLRARTYALLARLLAQPPGHDLLSALAAMDGDGSPLGEAFRGLADAARSASPEAVVEEHMVLFIGVGGSELTPYASYYLTGFLNEKPLADLRGDMARLGIARADDVRDPEDHIAALCEMMSGLIFGAFDAPATLDGQRAFYDRHIAPWASRFFADLETSPSAAFYRAVGTLGRRFLEVEGQAFAMAA
ncbi:TorD/DmsD family molecular chaperone [Azospirillum halopraeferens]|uniref:TorD/DmsD family molecular chaperone n=1 Tax=Azospirillum halopraeferens TaxID=34010 RepID=UPI000421E5FD|nr:molecular chaperone TorD family protein [Azospirillum halopraeferens]